MARTTPPAGSRWTTFYYLAGLLIAAAPLATSTAHGGEDKPEGDAGWKKRFHEVYRLERGETVKFIPAPFIPERGEYAGGAAAGRFRTTGQYILLWDDTKQGQDRLARCSFASASGTVTSGFFGCGEFVGTDVEYEGPEAERRKPLEGDWIFRKSATREERLKAVEEIVRKHAKVRVRATKKKEERDVLVARGKLEHKKLAGTPDDDALHVYTNELDREDGAGGGTSTLRQFLDHVGNCARHRVIDETKSSNVMVRWRNHRSAMVHKGNPNWLDQLVRNVQDQTGLQLKFERRPVELWVISVGQTAEGKDPPKEGL